jgi:Tfp pilus assembly protein PilN
MSGKRGGAIRPGPPRVNLMPAGEVARREQGILLRRWALGLLATAIVVGLAVTAALVLRIAADQRLAAEQQRTVELTAQLAEFVEVTETNANRTKLQDFVGKAAGNDLAWARLFRAITAALPDGVRLQGFQLTVGALPQAGSEPAAQVGLAGELTLRTNRAADQADTVAALRKLPGAYLVDAGDLTAGQTGGFSFVVTFVADQSLYTGRFEKGQR